MIEEWFMDIRENDGCCHKTRLKDGPCPIGWKCPYIKESDKKETKDVT